MKFILTLASLLFFGISTSGQNTENINLDAEYKLGIEALRNYQYQKALDHFFECQRVEVNNKEYLQKLAFCYQKLGDYNEAKLSYQSLLKKDSASVNAWSNLGSIYEKELNYKKASECYQQLLTIDSTNSYYFRQNAFVWLRLKKPLVAVAYFQKAYELNGRDLVVIDEYSALLLGMKQVELAEEIIGKGLRLAPDNLKLLYTKANILYYQKDYESIVSTLQHSMSLGDTVQYYQKMIAASYLHLEQFDSCIFHLNQIVLKKQDSELTHYQLALAYRGLENLPKSEEEYEWAIKMAISESTGLYYRNLALLLDEQNKLKPAIQAWKKAIEYSPDQSIYLYYLAKDCDTYYKDKKIARRYFRKFYKTKNPEYREYVRKRIQYLNGIIHQSTTKS